MLRGKRGLVVGIANQDSIAFGCAAKLRAFGAELAVTWVNEKAEKHVRPLAEQLGASIMLPLDVEQPGALEAVFDRIAATGAGSISSSIPSPSPRARTCMAGSSTARPRASARPCRCPAGPSCAWRSWPSR